MRKVKYVRPLVPARIGPYGVKAPAKCTDTGRTALVVRKMMPQAHFATVYAKPQGRPTVDTFVTEVSQDTWIYFPWDLDLAYVAPMSQKP